MTLSRSLSLLLRLAWRNLGRSRRRTLITGAGIVLGVSSCIAMFGLTDGLDDDLIGSVTRVELGDVQIHRPEWQTRHKLSLTLAHAAERAREVAKQPSVVEATPRAYGWAFASHGGRSLGVELMGIDPAEAIAVGDGANDLPMMEAAGLSIAYHPKPAVAARAKISITSGGLDRALEVLAA